MRCIIDMVDRDPWRSKAVSLPSNLTNLSINRLIGLDFSLYYKNLPGRGAFFGLDDMVL